MVKYPRYIFRRELVLKLINDYIPKASKFLEIGCADGELSSRIAKLGLTGDIYDISEEAVRKAQKLVKESGVDKKLNVYKADPLNQNITACYDLVIILEVLEHIEKDRRALTKVNSLLSDKGFLIISVPSKKKLWGPHDELVGHFRRYDKIELKSLLKQTGFEVVKLYSYGFPFLNTIKILRDLVAKRRLKSKVGSRLDLTKKSGLNPTNILALETLPIFNHYTLLPFIKFSNLFNKYDLAEGYLCLAEKKRESKNK